MTENSTLGKDLEAEISRLLRVGRQIKGLSISQAAKRLGISPFELKSVEQGSTKQPMNIVARAAQLYGMDFDFMNLTQFVFDEKIVRDRNRKKRTNLSVVGDDPKPWEQLPDSFNKIFSNLRKDERVSGNKISGRMFEEDYTQNSLA